MSDKKHLEYCIKLGNTIIQNKMEQLDGVNYANIAGTYSKPQNTDVDFSNYKAPQHNEDFINFRSRLQNWK